MSLEFCNSRWDVIAFFYILVLKHMILLFWINRRLKETVIVWKVYILLVLSDKLKGFHPHIESSLLSGKWNKRQFPDYKVARHLVVVRTGQREGVVRLRIHAKWYNNLYLQFLSLKKGLKVTKEEGSCARPHQRADSVGYKLFPLYRPYFEEIEPSVIIIDSSIWERSRIQSVQVEELTRIISFFN